VKTLLILRHAKSSWKNMSLEDHDRPLNKRGKRSAKRMGRLLAQEDLRPDLILSSTAARARKTARRVAAAAGFEGEIELLDEFYHARPMAYLDAVARVSDGLDRVMVVGHNPGLEDLVAETTSAYERMPTAALAQVEYAIEHWFQVLEARGTLAHIWRPRELEA